MLQAGLAGVHVDDASASESPDEDTQLPEEYRYPCQLCPGGGLGGSARCPLPTRRRPPARRDLLAHFTTKPRFIPAVHPGEPVFWDAAFVRNGGLSLLYRCAPTCPLPVLRWLFQVSHRRKRALWEIWLSTGGERGPWCPTVQEIGWAFTRLGADLSPLYRQRLLPPELCPTERSARLALITLLSFLGLDRALRCQPLPELQHLLHCLLEGIRDWQEQLPALCLSLCQLSRHHHNLVALLRLLPDLTSRGRYVPARSAATGWDARQSWQRWPARRPVSRRTLTRRWVLPSMENGRRGCPAPLSVSPRARSHPQACYLSYSLLLLASNVVGSEHPPAEQRGHLEQLCAQLDRHFGRGLREGSGLLFRTQLKGLAALLYVKWQEMLA
uniref:Coiled-coil SMC6 And NSE5 INteracting (CANIN) domain-containing protein n=1 Tax=Aquila chrysaetos chrysaetos TaxID=223781 RepID=A0A663EQK4_AQUCH